MKSKSELEKTREDFNMTIYDVSLKLNGISVILKMRKILNFNFNLATEKELNEMKISVENLSMELKGKPDIK